MSELLEFIYDPQGNPVAFHEGRYIYNLHGIPLGQIKGSHVHHLGGAYVGELYQDMVVDQYLGNVGFIGNPGDPGRHPCPSLPARRPAAPTDYPDVFYKLLEA